MKTSYNSKEEFEQKHPYVLVHFETRDSKTIATIDRDFTNKKSADKYFSEICSAPHFEVMTRKKFYKNALVCM